MNQELQELQELLDQAKANYRKSCEILSRARLNANNNYDLVVQIEDKIRKLT